MWKCLFKVTQLQYHLKNWSNVPKSIQRNLTRLASDIHPPDPVDTITTEIKTILTNAGEAIKQKVLAHLNTRLHTNREALKAMDPTDARGAVEIAFKHLNKRFGGKIEDLKTKIIREADIIGTNRDTSPETVLKTPAAKRARQESSPHSPTFGPNPESPTLRTLMELEEPSPPPSDPMPQTNKKTIHDMFPPDYNIWSGCTNLIIADEALEHTLASDLPESWQLDIIPGAKLKHVWEIVNEYGYSPEHNFIMAMGHNYRWEKKSTIQNDIDQLAKVLDPGESKFYAMSVCTPKNTTMTEHNNIVTYNHGIESHFGSQVIPPISKDDTILSPDNKHYTADTARIILRRISAHLSYPNLP
jgi:hypothetical protein